MPNGGPDCCGNCGFNRAVQEMAHPHPHAPEKFWDISNCTLRDIKVCNPFWTYCDNFDYGKTIPSAADTEAVELKGPITGSGLYEGYVRVPWHGAFEPNVQVPCTCSVCGRETKTGITIFHEDRQLGFCTNRHYVEWWKTEHDDPEISADFLDTPEEFYAR